MQKFQLLSPSEQVANHLKALLGQGRWTGLMPGTGTLANEMPGVDRKAVGAALQILVKDGWLEDQGVGKKRKILPRASSHEFGKKIFRVGILKYAGDGDYRLEKSLRQQLARRVDVTLEFSPQSIIQLQRDIPKITKMTESMDVDAWIVPAASKEVLESMDQTGKPVYAVFGRHKKLDIDGFSFDSQDALEGLTQKISNYGHKRMCCVTRKERRLPALGESERTIFSRLAADGIQPNTFTLPDWEETPAGFHKLLDALFRFTPPTALIIPETYLVTTALQFFAAKRIRVPEDLSIICMEDCEEFKWSVPHITCITRDFNQPAQEIAKWITTLQSGKPAPRKKTIYPAQFFEGGTLVAPKK